MLKSRIDLYYLHGLGLNFVVEKGALKMIERGDKSFFQLILNLTELSNIKGQDHNILKISNEIEL